jgi:hypothetical protein
MTTMHKKITKADIGATIVFGQFYIYFLYLYMKNPLVLATFFFMSVLTLSFIKINTQYKFYYQFFFIYLIVLLTFSLISKEYEFYISMYNLLYLYTALNAAYFMVNSSLGLFFAKACFFSYSIFLSYFIFKFGNDVDAYNTILDGSSRNYLSAISIFLTINFYIHLKLYSNKVVLYPAIINLILCAFLFGRSGIALSFAILLVILFDYNKKIFICISFIATITVITNYNLINSFLIEKSNFALGVESERTLFRKEYLNHIFNNSEFIRGRAISNCCTYIQSYGNPHNSFIMGHMRYGISHSILALIIISFILIKRDLIMIFFTLIIYSRYFLDQLGLFTHFDFIIFSILFILIKSTSYKINSSKLSHP